MYIYIFRRCKDVVKRKHGGKWGTKGFSFTTMLLTPVGFGQGFLRK